MYIIYVHIYKAMLSKNQNIASGMLIYQNKYYINIENLKNHLARPPSPLLMDDGKDHDCEVLQVSFYVKMYS